MTPDVEKYQGAVRGQGLGQQGRYPPLIGDDTHYNRWAQQQQQQRMAPIGRPDDLNINWAEHMRAGPPNPQLVGPIHPGMTLDEHRSQYTRAGPPNPQPRHNSPTPQAVALAAALEAAAVALLTAVALLRKP